MANIGWGKAGIYLCDLDVENSEWIQAPTPVENSTNLTPTKGSKQEAKLEGGENEDVRYGANNYALAYQIRRAKNKEMPIKHIDGIVAHNYGVIVVPADDKVPSACYIERSVVSRHQGQRHGQDHEDCCKGRRLRRRREGDLHGSGRGMIKSLQQTIRGRKGDRSPDYNQSLLPRPQ